MKIGFIGKGGSGKTTVCALTAKRAAQLNRPVVAIDADINQHLASALGFSEQEIANAPTLDADQQFVKSFLRGSNPRIRPESFFKTTPPGAGSHLIGVQDNNPIEQRFGIMKDKILLMLCGMHRESDIGVHCYHGKTSIVDMILNHTVDSQHEYVMVDMTAGADAFSSTLFTRFDLMVLVVEPTLKSVGVLRQYQELGAGYDLPLVVVGNKISCSADLEFVKRHTGEHFQGHLRTSEYIKALDRGDLGTGASLEPENLVTIDSILTSADARRKDWDKYLRQLLDIHTRIGPAWGGGAPKDLLEQIDPDFTYPSSPNWKAETVNTESFCSACG